MPMRIGTEMPSLEGATEWFNATGAAAAEGAKGHPTLVHFWSVSCGTCKENLPRVAEWRDARAAEGLRVVAHTVVQGHGAPPGQGPQTGPSDWALGVGNTLAPPCAGAALPRSIWQETAN